MRPGTIKLLPSKHSPTCLAVVSSIYTSVSRIMLSQCSVQWLSHAKTCESICATNGRHMHTNCLCTNGRHMQITMVGHAQTVKCTYYRTYVHTTSKLASVGLAQARSNDSLHIGPGRRGVATVERYYLRSLVS